MLRERRLKEANIFAKIRASFIFKPLTLGLALCLLPNVPDLPRFSLAAPARAATTGNCVTNGTNYFVTDCTAPAALDANVVKAFLSYHGLPSTDAALIKQYARADVYTELRVMMLAYVVNIIKKPADTRNADEASIYNWLQYKAWAHEKQEWSTAVANRNSWESNPCAWKPDANVATQYGLTYDSSYYCGQSGVISLFEFNAPIPTRDYFLAAAIPSSYGLATANDPNGNTVLYHSVQDTSQALRYGSIAGGATVAFFAAATAAYVAAGALTTAAGGAAFGISGLAVASTGPVGVVILCIIAVVVSTIEVTQEQQVKARLDGMDAENAQVQSIPPSLEGLSNDSTGFLKIRLCLNEATLPETDSTTAPPAHRSTDYPVVVITPSGPGFSETAANSFTYTDWFGTKWTASTYGGWFTQQGVDTKGNTVYSLSPTLHMVDGTGTKYIASLVGNLFAVAKEVISSATPNVCPVGPAGYTTGDTSGCDSFVTPAIPFKDANGNPAEISLSLQPHFTSSNTFGAAAGSLNSFTITASGTPGPTISLASSLPAGFGFTANPGTGTATLTNGLVAEGTYTFNLSANNGTPFHDTQTVTIAVTNAVSIVPSTPPQVVSGIPYSWTIAASGTLPISWSNPGTLFPGLSFTDNGNGTATISGTAVLPALPSGLYGYQNILFNLTASSGSSHTQATQQVILSAQQPWAAALNQTGVTFTDGLANAIRLTTSGTGGNAVSFSLAGCGAPSWMTLADQGDGTAILGGTPPFAPFTINGSTALTVATAGVQGQGNCNALLGYAAEELPLLPSPLYTIGTAGSSFANPPQTNIPGATTSLSGSLPPGVIFLSTGNGGWAFEGVPPAGSGGEYDTLLTLTTSQGAQSQTMHMLVNQPPAFIGPNTLAVYSGLVTNYTIPVSGFPKAPLGQSYGSEPISGMSYQIVSGSLPPGLTLRTTSPNGGSTGTAVISGMILPQTAGPYPVTVTAANGIGGAQQTLTLNVFPAGDANQDGAVSCLDVTLVKASMGAYRGTPKYNQAADFNNDGVVNALDLAVVTGHLPSGVRCQ